MIDLIHLLNEFIPYFVYEYDALLIFVPTFFSVGQLIIYSNLGKAKEVPAYRIYKHVEKELGDEAGFFMTAGWLLVTHILIPLMILAISHQLPGFLIFFVCFFFFIVFISALCHLRFVKEQWKLFFWERLSSDDNK